MREPRWVPAAAVIAMHAELLREHGGLVGPPRLSALHGALVRPRQLFAYGAATDRTLARLAACYAYGLARDHCFPDGNKRIALATLDVFLQLNGKELTAPEPDAVSAIVSLSAGTTSEAELAVWIGEHLTRAE
jgi:death-on-curing protein